MTGKQILNYRIERLLGEGGMSSVYLGVHNQLDRKVAVKVLHPHLAANPHIRERFKNEAAAMANLQHPNIVALYDFLDQADGLYLIMEYVEGMPLDEYISKITGPIPEEKAFDLFMGVLNAFDYAHRKGVVHRDIKPSNIMVTAEGEVKVLDFGIAKLISSETSNKLTRTGMRMGTVLYMSPEQIKGGSLDLRSDIYSLGVTLFEMLTARNPYDEANASEFDIQVKIVNEPLPRARSFYPMVSDPVQFIIDKATAKKPEYRFQSCEEFRQAIRQRNSITANVPTEKPPLTAQTQAKAAVKPPAKSTSGVRRTLRTLLFLLLGGGIVALIVFATGNEFTAGKKEREEREKRGREEKEKQEAKAQEEARQEEEKRRFEEMRQKMQQEQQNQQAESKKQYYREHLRELVNVDCSSYTSSSNGITNLSVKVTNLTDYHVDQVRVYVEYYSMDGDSLSGKAQQEVLFRDIIPNSTQTMEGLYSPKGSSVKCSLIEITSKALAQ